MNNVRTGFLDAIGNTPLIRLRGPSEATGCEIYGKAEFLNPGGSIKDRAALAMIDDAERRGKLKPGGIIVEGTAGNVGIGIALVANARGYRSVIVMPETQSQEKKDMLRLCGADLRLVPAVPYSNPGHYARYSGQLAEELGAFWANQFDNVANREGHYRTTGPEIWAQTERTDRRLYLCRRQRRYLGWDRAGAERAKPRHQDRAQRSHGRRSLQLVHQGRTDDARATPSWKGSGKSV